VQPDERVNDGKPGPARPWAIEEAHATVETESENVLVLRHLPIFSRMTALEEPAKT
jgi:hypothetical protein